MICKNCHSEIEATAKFCENCGTEMGAKDSKVNHGLLKVIAGSVVLLYCLSVVAYVLKSDDYFFLQMAMSVIVIAASWVLFFTKQIKLSLSITVNLLSVYAFLGAGVHYLPFLLFMFFAAAVTVLIYKYSFAENKKLL